MKKFFFCVVAALALALSANAQETQSSGWPTGMMTYNSWSGKISVGGVTMEKYQLPHYFTEEEMKMFQTSQGLYVGALVLAVGTGVSLGVGIASLASAGGEDGDSFKKTGTALLIAGGVGLAATFTLDIIAGNMRKKAINGYNSRALSYQPGMKLKVSPVGIGLAYNF